MAAFLRFAGLAPFALAVGCMTTPEPTVKVDINLRPEANAGDDQELETADVVELDGSASFDPDGDPIKYHWTFDHLPEVSTLPDMENAFPGNHTATATTWFSPDAVGTYVVQLVVEDDAGLESDPDFLIVTVNASEAPVADAGTDQEGTTDELVSLDGSGSYDSKGRDLTYSWTFATVPTTSSVTDLTDGDSATPSFTPDVGGVYIAALVVNNGLANSDSDSVVARVSSADPTAPVALAGDDVIDAEDCTEVALDGSGSYDANDDDLTYAWSIHTKPDGSSATDDANIGDKTAVTTTFYPDVAGDFEIALTLFDGTDWATPDLVAITAAERSYNNTPVVDAGEAQTIDGGSADCELDGYTYECESCSTQTVPLGLDATVTDADSDSWTVVWEVTSGEASIADSTSLSTEVSLSEAYPTEPDYPEDNEYVFTATVTDCVGATHSDTVTFVLQCTGSEAGDTGSKK